ncbi:LacI family DNA-binding transcriptional regulator [Brenneria corticis]|uniref:Cytochrome-c peroxidase n=1 Tax=Brenneria corticis TaxID=2173106 RepID=A0A2U1UB91_9GAMM|nr:LacI family DNA-binding transcriptional regulator [Brenneria sp. CFCC 11842]PWC18939.1 cytochrome-c peroxidase [Brenneria sp. CFCC 11842]
MSGKLKIREIAFQTGLSISTVSRVLSGKANTSENAKQRVLTCAHQYGVLDELAAGRLLLNGITLFAPSRAFDARTDIFYYRVIQGVVNALRPHEVRVRYCCLEENDSDAALFMEKMNDPTTEAALLIGIDDAYVHALAADLGKPCVLINCRDRRMRLPSVAPDHQLLGEMAANYLIEQGHHHILNLLCLRRYTMEQRLQGIKEAMKQHNLPFEEEHHLLAVNGFGTAESYHRMSAFLRRPPPETLPTVILAGGDFMADGAVTALQDAGIRVPQDISVMSVDGFNMPAIHGIPLTSLHVPREELGEEAIRMLQRRLICPTQSSGNLLLHGVLVMGESVKRIRVNNAHTPINKEGLYD